MSLTIEDILDALPEPPQVVNMRDSAGNEIATNTRIHLPDDAAKFKWSAQTWVGDYPTIAIVFDDGSGMSGRWPVADLLREPSGTVRLIGPLGIASIVHVELPEEE